MAAVGQYYRLDICSELDQFWTFMGDCRICHSFSAVNAGPRASDKDDLYPYLSLMWVSKMPDGQSGMV